jgi:hypothetical protein
VSYLYHRDKKRIEVFVKRHGKGNANLEIVRRATHYAKVLDAWESLGA